MPEEEKLTFTLYETEVLEYYFYLFFNLKHNKWNHLFIRFSIPALIFMTIMFFHLPITYWTIGIFLCITFLWYKYIGENITKALIDKQVCKWHEKNKEQIVLKEVNVIFDNKKSICYVDSLKIPYSNIKQVVWWKSLVLVFYNQNDLFVIPERILGNKQDAEKWISEKQLLFYRLYSSAK